MAAVGLSVLAAFGFASSAVLARQGMQSILPLPGVLVSLFIRLPSLRRNGVAVCILRHQQHPPGRRALDRGSRRRELFGWAIAELPVGQHDWRFPGQSVHSFTGSLRRHFRRDFRRLEHPPLGRLGHRRSGGRTAFRQWRLSVAGLAYRQVILGGLSHGPREPEPPTGPLT